MNFNFNFKKNNLLIILLLVVVILSCIVYFNMLNIKEGMTNILQDRIQYKGYLTSLTESTTSPDPSYNYYKLLPTTRSTDESYKLVDIPTSFNITDFSINDVSYNTRLLYTDASFISDHSLNGMFSISDGSNAIFYKPTINSRIDIHLDISSSTSSKHNFNILLKELSGNIYHPSTNVFLNNLNITIHPNTTQQHKLVEYGKFVLRPATTSSQTDPVSTQIQTLSGGTATATSTGSSVTLGDTNLNLGSLMSLFGRGDPDLDSELFAYLLQNGALGSSYVPPIYNNFETAMNLPSNPIVNPINSMNPLEYAETLFGPNITPVMAKNSYLNQSNATKLDTSTNTMKAIGSQTPNFDSNGNLLAQNSSTNLSNNTNNTINSKKNIATEDYPPCPAPQRCPEPNFECKKIPKYEQGTDNAFLPRPVLTDFSTFGM